MVISSFSCKNYPSWDHCDNDRRTKKTLVRESILNVAEKHVMKLPAPPRRQYYKWLCNTGMALSHSEAWVTSGTRAVMIRYWLTLLYETVNVMGYTQDRIYTLLIRPSKYYQIIFPFSASLLSACQYFIWQLPGEQICKHLTRWLLHSSPHTNIDWNVKTSVLMSSLHSPVCFIPVLLFLSHCWLGLLNWWWVSHNRTHHNHPLSGNKIKSWQT